MQMENETISNMQNCAQFFSSRPVLIPFLNYCDSNESADTRIGAQ